MTPIRIVKVSKIIVVYSFYHNVINKYLYTKSKRMLLTEDRVSQVKEKYSIPTEVWEPMVTGSAAIAKNQKYLEWIAKTWRDKVSRPEYAEFTMPEQLARLGTSVLNGLLTTIEKFDRVRPNLKKKDLYQYRDRQEIIDALENWDKEKTRHIETHKESEVVYEDDRFKVVVPKSHTASCYYGAGTKWCTATKDSDSHFTNYDKEGKLFYILDKSAPTSDDYYKVALNKTYKGSNTFYDAKDDSIPDKEDIDKIFTHPELINKINEYFNFTYKDEIAKISEEEKQNELDRLAREAVWAARRREREQRLEQSAFARREGDEWNLENTDVVGTMANVLMEWLIGEGEFEDNLTQISDTENEIEDIRVEMENDPEVIADPNGERAQDYGEDLNNLEEEIEVLKLEGHDIYDIRYDGMEHYDLPVFEYGGAEYAVGDDDMADEAGYQQVDNLIDDIGFNGFSEGFADYYIDADAVADDFEQYFWDNIEDSPEDYLDEDSDTELTSEAKDQLEAMDEQMGEYQEELEDGPDESRDEYLVGQIEAIEEAKQELEEDEDNYEYTQEAKEKYVDNRLWEVRDDPISFLRDYGWDDSIERYVDREAFINGVLETDGRAHGLAGYDGNENEVSLDDGWYLYL